MGTVIQRFRVVFIEGMGGVKPKPPEIASVHRIFILGISCIGKSSVSTDRTIIVTLFMERVFLRYSYISTTMSKHMPHELNHDTPESFMYPIFLNGVHKNSFPLMLSPDLGRAFPSTMKGKGALASLVQRGPSAWIDMRILKGFETLTDCLEI
jgi:hypothetical protein